MGRQVLAVALDFSAGAEAAFAAALEQARRVGARLLLIHVIPPLLTPSPLLDDVTTATLGLELRRGLDRSAHQRMEGEYAPRAADLETEVMIVDGDPARELARLCGEKGVDTLYMGSTGLSGLAETIFGSVAAKVVRKAPCSVMVVRPPAPTQGS